MTVIYVVDTFPSLTETFIEREVEALAQSGFDTAVFALRSARIPAASGAGTRLATRVRRSPAMATVAGLRAHLSQACHGPGSYARMLFRHLVPNILRPRRFLRNVRLVHRAVSLARLIVDTGEAAHVHAQFAHVTAKVAREASRLTACAFSVGTHAWDIYGQSDADTVTFLEDAVFVTCCTQKGIERLRELLPKARHGELVLLRHGLGMDLQKHAARSKGNLILGVGRLVRKKGFCNLIDACHILAHRGIQLKCLIIGDGPLERPLRNMIAALGLDDSVRILGSMPQERIIELLAGEAAVFVLPSVVAPDGDRDGLPNTVLEAMAVGLPVISTTACAANEAITDGENGLLVDPDDPEDLAQHIEELLADEKKRRRLGQTARQTIEHSFNSLQCVQPLVDRLRSVTD